MALRAEAQLYFHKTADLALKAVMLKANYQLVRSDIKFADRAPTPDV